MISNSETAVYPPILIVVFADYQAKKVRIEGTG